MSQNIPRVVQLNVGVGGFTNRNRDSRIGLHIALYELVNKPIHVILSAVLRDRLTCAAWVISNHTADVDLAELLSQHVDASFERLDDSDDGLSHRHFVCFLQLFVNRSGDHVSRKVQLNALVVHTLNVVAADASASFERLLHSHFGDANIVSVQSVHLLWLDLLAPMPI